MNYSTLKNRFGQILFIIFVIFAGVAGAQSREVDIKLLEMRDGTRYFVGEGSPYSGTGLVRYPDGKIALKIAFHNGIQHGYEIGWYQNGRFKHKILYRFGQPQTLGSRWYENKQEEEDGLLLCDEKERLAGFCDKDIIDEVSRFELCLEGEESEVCGQSELEPSGSVSVFRFCTDDEC